MTPYASGREASFVSKTETPSPAMSAASAPIALPVQTATTATSLAGGYAVAAPLLLLAYGLLRLLDGLDGSHGPGLAWNLGHLAFLAAVVAFGVLVVGLRRMAPTATRRDRLGATAATTTALAGLAAFCWVILGDLLPTWKAAAPLPDPLYAAGPLCFLLGLLVLLVQLAVVAPRRLSAWSPLLVLAGFAPIVVDLNLLPVGALLLLAGLAPIRHVRRPAR